MYKALTDQYKDITLSNELNIISNVLSSCKSDETNECKYNDNKSNK